MAGIVVNFVVNKLLDAALKEIFSLCGVEEKVERVKRELIRIRCFLKDADRKCARDEMVKNWVKELREVSHWIEDAIDLFVLDVEESGEKNLCAQEPMKKKIKRWFEKPGKTFLIHKFGNEMDKILARIDEIAASRENYGIENLVESDESVVVVPIIPDLNEIELVGVEAEKERIVHELVDENCLRRSVVSIVGPGGIGKSTVAAKVYSSDEVKSRFDVLVWLSISQNFTLIDLLEKILEEIGCRPSSNTTALLMREVNKLLQEKRYLIVMDDVWSEDLWPQIAPVLPDSKNGSRVLITSRFRNVPIVADPGSQPNILRFLNEEESLKLLLRTALRNRAATESFLANISDLSNQLAQKCDGLPLALVVLGGLLSRRPLTYHAWQNVSRTMVWSEEGKRCMDILTTSYDDMSVELKSCFMSLAATPEEYKLEATILIQLWVAEGLIPHISSRTLEDTAEEYLEELAERSMVQVFERHPWGSIRRCGLHDVMREVATQKATEQNFLTICSNRDVEQSCGRAGRTRRVAVHHSDCEVMKHASSNLRSFYCSSGQMQNYSRHRLLRVLHFEFDGRSVELKRIGNLTQLRYLRLTGFFEENDEPCLNKFIAGLKYLQTLDFSCLVGDYSLPDCIWYIKSLRHVLLCETKSGPPPSSDLEFLQTLWGVDVPKSWESTTLPNLRNLRKLKIEKHGGSSWEILVAFLHKLKNLESLEITGEGVPREVVDMRSFSFYPLLKSLYLFGNFSAFDPNITQLDATMFPSHLTSLSLYNSNIEQDVMHVLENLQDLKFLYLAKYFCTNTKLRCSAGGFPQLEDLTIVLSEGMEWEIEEGAMPVLKYLTINCFSRSQVIHGLEHLTTLRGLIGEKRRA